jgi:hypothetical protein
MMYFTIEQEMNHHDLIEYLLGYANDNSKTILEVSQEYQLEEIILDVLDTNIGQNVDPYECIEDIEENIDEYVKTLIDNVDDNYKCDLMEELEDFE